MVTGGPGIEVKDTIYCPDQIHPRSVAIYVSSDWWFPTVVWVGGKGSWSQNWIQAHKQTLRSYPVVGRLQNLYTAMLFLQGVLRMT